MDESENERMDGRVRECECGWASKRMIVGKDE